MNVGVIRWEESEEERVGKVKWRWIAEAGVRRLIHIVGLVIDFEQGGIGGIHRVNLVQGRGDAFGLSLGSLYLSSLLSRACLVI